MNTTNPTITANFGTLAAIKRETGRPSDTVAAFVARVGYDAAIETIAAAINTKAHDGRISDHNRAWAQGVTLAGIGEYLPGIDGIHPAHLDQIADAARRAERPAEPEPEQEPEPTEPTESTNNTTNTNPARIGYNTPELREKMRIALDFYLSELDAGHALRVSISAGNRKTHIPSISLPPVITCPRRCLSTCAPFCYANKDCNLHTNEIRAYCRNLAIYTRTPGAYFDAVRLACANARFFRWHVAGDIPSPAYFAGMIDVARTCPGTTFLAFTKRYEIVNSWIDENGALPANLKILFSGWIGLDPINPHNLPTTTVYPRKSEPRPEWLLCGGNCLECACRGVGCWQLKSGETLAFRMH